VSDLTSRRNLVDLAGITDAGYNCAPATFGVFLLPILKEKFGVASVLGIVSGVSLLGLLVTLIFKCDDAE